jgi:hypothetical protein
MGASVGFVKHRACIEQHDAAANCREVVFDFVVRHDGMFWHYLFKQLA